MAKTQKIELSQTLRDAAEVQRSLGLERVDPVRLRRAISLIKAFREADFIHFAGHGGANDVELSETERELAGASINVSSVIIPAQKLAEGVLIQSTSIAWLEIVKRLEKNWLHAFEIPPAKWEELIAGAFHEAGYDEVVLTPRSGDFGRDVIAFKHGVGCIKIIGSVKAYGQGRLVRHDDVRALLGVLSGESNTSKGIITTTSDFAPTIRTDPFIKPFLPTRLELLNGAELQKWLMKLAEKK